MCKWLLAPLIWDRLATRPSWLRARYVREGVVHGLDKVALDVGDLVASGGEATTISSAFSAALRSSKTLGAGSANTRGWASTRARTLFSAGSRSVSSPARTR